MDVRFSRFIDIFDGGNFNHNVSVVGAGSVGSNVVLHLAKMGIRDISVCDPDSVSEENIGVSLLYGPSDVGLAKVEVLSKKVHELTGTPINAFKGVAAEFEDNILSSNIIISTVDTIKARQEIFDKIKTKPKVRLYIDTAMGGVQLSAKVVDMRDADSKIKYMQYINSLSDESVPDIRCTAKSTIHGTSVIASFVCSVITHFSTFNGPKFNPPVNNFNFNLTIFDYIDM